MNRRTLLMGVCAAGCGARGARASAYPTHGITLIVPFSPGSSVGIGAQALRPHLERALGQTVELQFSAGAGGAMGHLLGASAAGDGYTVTMVSASLAVQRWLIKASTVGPDDFTFVGQVTSLPCVLLTRVESAFETLAELVATLRAGPESVSTGELAGWPSPSLAQAVFALQAGIKPRVVSSFYSGAELLEALENGQLDIAMVGTQELRLPLAARRLKALGVTSHARVPILPATPTFREQGWDVTNAWWRGLAVPRDTPEEIVGTLAAALDAALANPALHTDFARNGLSVDPLDGPTMSRRVYEEYQAIGRLFASLGINVRVRRPS